jgi:hypothetical protein
MAVDLIEEAVSAGARRFKACAVLEIDVRTLQRWQKALKERDALADRRKAAGAERPPANKPCSCINSMLFREQTAHI